MALNIIDTVIFDLGGVLIDWSPRRLFEKIFTNEKEMDYFLQEVCTPNWNEQQDAGRPIAEATQLLLDQFPKYELEIRAFYGRWTEMLGGAITGTVDILRHIKEDTDYRLYALTNWSAETFPHAIERFDFLQWFEGTLVSGDEMMKKPDPRIYQLICDRYQIVPQQAVFIDDSLRNIKAAEAFGLQVIHFQSPEQLRKDMQQLGLL